MKINPISFCFLPVSSYLCGWIRQEPLPDILVKNKALTIIVVFRKKPRKLSF